MLFLKSQQFKCNLNDKSSNVDCRISLILSREDLPRPQQPIFAPFGEAKNMGLVLLKHVKVMKTVQWHKNQGPYIFYEDCSCADKQRICLSCSSCKRQSIWVVVELWSHKQMGATQMWLPVRNLYMWHLSTLTYQSKYWMMIWTALVALLMPEQHECLVHWWFWNKVRMVVVGSTCMAVTSTLMDAAKDN